MIFTSYDRCQNISGHPVNEDAGSEYVAFMEEMTKHIQDSSVKT